jgi:hypothetical protein
MITINDEMGRIRKQVVVTNYNVLFQNLSEGAGELKRKPHSR